jgi:predicted tellurium resistance membrane protein TerC
MNQIQIHSLRLIFIIFCIAVVSNGCTLQDSKPYDRSLVLTYAELTLLYEKEKMTNRLTDSLYQIKVTEFFSGKGLEQQTFKKTIDKMTEYPQVWKVFIQDVTTAMDSIRNSADIQQRKDISSE